MEMEDFGYPPVFRDAIDIDELKEADVDAEPVVKEKAKGKKVKSRSCLSLCDLLTYY